MINFYEISKAIAESFIEETRLFQETKRRQEEAHCHWAREVEKYFGGYQ